MIKRKSTSDVSKRFFRSAPDVIKTPINIQRSRKYWRDSGCIFVHVPKAAGTSIAHALYGRHLYHFRAEEVKRYAPRLFRSLCTLAIVRNPWERVLSAYRFACVGSTGIMGVSKPEQYRLPEFETFERFLVEWLAIQDIKKIDQIFQPQFNFVCNSFGEVIIDHVGRLEELAVTEAFLSSYLGRKIAFQRLNSTRGSMPGYKTEYVSSEMRRIVAEIYAGDIAIFGYEF